MPNRDEFVRELFGDHTWSFDGMGYNPEWQQSDTGDWLKEFVFLCNEVGELLVVSEDDAKKYGRVEIPKAISSWMRHKVVIHSEEDELPAAISSWMENSVLIRNEVGGMLLISEEDAKKYAGVEILDDRFDDFKKIFDRS